MSFKTVKLGNGSKTRNYCDAIELHFEFDFLTFPEFNKENKCVTSQHDNLKMQLSFGCIYY